MTRDELLAFMRAQRYAVQASVSRTRASQAAVVGIAVSDDFEIVFDTLIDSRKATNLRANPLIAFVIGSTHDGAKRTVQYEGVADMPPATSCAARRRSTSACSRTAANG